MTKCATCEFKVAQGWRRWRSTEPIDKRLRHRYGWLATGVKPTVPGGGAPLTLGIQGLRAGWRKLSSQDPK